MKIINRLRELIFEPSDQYPQDASNGEHNYQRIIVPEQVFEATSRGLRSHGPSGIDHEGVVLWAGVTIEQADAKLVTSCIVPEADTSPGSFDISPDADARVVRAIDSHNLSGIGLLHSHPGPNTDHSGGDDEDAGLVFNGYYSIVVPNYAKDGVRPLAQCGVHRYENGNFRQLPTETVERQFVTIPSPPEYIDASEQ